MMPKLTQQELESALWDAADTLRGSIDSSDYKNYIFGFLFLKRLSDQFQEEAERIFKETEDEDLAYNEPDEHRFFVPVEARWSRLQTLTEKLGEELDKACEKLEDQNPSLAGILIGIDFNDERKLGDQKQLNNTMAQLIQTFSKLNLRNDNLSEPDLLGRAYEYLIEKFADDAGKKGGEFYTPRHVVELCVTLLEPQEGMRICDPTCGSGGMLIATAKYIRAKGGNPLNLTLYGQEKNAGTAAICKMNMLLHGYPDAVIERGDTLTTPKLLLDDALRPFDRVIANPPFSLKIDDKIYEFIKSDPYKRFVYGIPPESKADLAFVQHMIASLNQEGKACIIVPHGVLFRGGKESEIRKKFLEGLPGHPGDLIEAVIGLPTNLFYGTGIPAAILVFNKAKRPERHNKVLFVDASRDYQDNKKQNKLRDQDIQKIKAAYDAFEPQAQYAAVVSIEEIASNDYNLNISRYVTSIEPEREIDLEGAIARLKELEAERIDAETQMYGYLRELGFQV
jgi:type I restriction enzyme M protein